MDSLRDQLLEIVKAFESVLPSERAATIRGLVRSGEEGVALEVLCDNLAESDVAVSQALLDKIVAVGSALGLGPSVWQTLRAATANHWRKLLLLGDPRDVIRETVAELGRDSETGEVAGSGGLWLAGDIVEFSLRQERSGPGRLAVFGCQVRPWFPQTLAFVLSGADHIVFAHIAGTNDQYLTRIQEISPKTPVTIVRQEPVTSTTSLGHAFEQACLQAARALIGSSAAVARFPVDFPYLPDTFNPCYESKVSGWWGPRSGQLRSDIPLKSS